MKLCDTCVYGNENEYHKPCIVYSEECEYYISRRTKMSIGKDNINPDHYKSECSLECIEAMDLIFGQKAVLDFCVCNAWKYIWRWKNKNGIEDLHKADWYLNRTCHYSDVESSELHSMVSRVHEYIVAEIDKWEEEHDNQSE